MAGHFHPGRRQPHNRHFHTRPSFPYSPRVCACACASTILTFYGCGCTYQETIPEQRPLHTDRFLHVELLPGHPPSRKIHISGACRIHEFAQFLTVLHHILPTECHRVLEAKSKGDDVEAERIRVDAVGRMDGMGLKLMGRWSGFRVVFDEGPQTLRFGAGKGFTREERVMHEGGEGEVGNVFAV